VTEVPQADPEHAVPEHADPEHAVPEHAVPEQTVAERLQLRLGQLTPAERKVARALMADYPVAGLVPIARLSAISEVSAPTVVRLIAKLAFDSYADFQQSLKSEVSARLSSPLQMHAGRPESGRDGGLTRTDALSRTEALLIGGIRASFSRVPPAEFELAIRLITDPRRNVSLVGGRFSSMLADYLAAHLRILRPGVHLIPPAGADRISSILDLGRRDVLVAFDYRRYQHDTVRLAAAAKEQGATVIVFTDPYLSPLSAHADVILTSSVQSPSPFDALTPAVALVEALVAAVMDRLGDLPRPRMARYDALYDGTIHGPREET
jgi:DNA-binding MurR/RpiR family transcriptional regulator